MCAMMEKFLMRCGSIYGRIIAEKRSKKKSATKSRPIIRRYRLRRALGGGGHAELEAPLESVPYARGYHAAPGDTRPVHVAKYDILPNVCKYLLRGAFDLRLRDVLDVRLAELLLEAPLKLDVRYGSRILYG